MTEESFQNNFFDTEYLKTDLKGRSVRGGAVTMAAQGASFFLQMGSTVVLARLLTPQDFGLIAMVTAVTGFVLMFKDMGLSMATVQKAEVNHAQISTLFWINVGLSLGVMLVIAALAPAIAWFYNEPRLTWITLALAGAFVFGGFTIQHQALLRRNMRFGSLALIQIISMSVGILTAIIAAWYGGGYWSLVLMQLATAITSAIAVWVVCGWRPGLPVRRSGVREMLVFGGHLTFFNIISYFSRNLDNILIGWRWGSGPLGLYSKAYGLLMLPLRQINAPLSAVAIPVLSRLQEEPERYRRFYCRLLNVIAFITMPLVLGMAAVSEQLVYILLGKQWLRAATIFKILAFVAVAQPLAQTRGWLLVSLGQTRRYIYWGLISGSAVVVSFIVGLPWGPVGVAFCYTVCGYMLLYPAYKFAFRYSPIKMKDLYYAIRRPLPIAIAMYLCMELTKLYVISWGAIWTLVMCSAVGFLVLALAILLWPAARSEALNILECVRLLRKSK